MTPRPAPHRLENLGPLTTHFKRRSGKTSHYREFLFYWDGTLGVAGYDDTKVRRPLLVNGEVIFDTAFKAFRVQRVGETYTTISIFSLDDKFLGTYSDTTMPWGGVRETRKGHFETDIDDLYLDHYIMPDGRSFVLDLGELNEGLAIGSISTAEAELALETATVLEERHRAGSYPSEDVSGVRLDPALLRGLPTPQD